MGSDSGRKLEELVRDSCDVLNVLQARICLSAEKDLLKNTLVVSGQVLLKENGYNILSGNSSHLWST